MANLRCQECGSDELVLDSCYLEDYDKAIKGEMHRVVLDETKNVVEYLKCDDCKTIQLGEDINERV